MTFFMTFRDCLRICADVCEVLMIYGACLGFWVKLLWWIDFLDDFWGVGVPSHL